MRAAARINRKGVLNKTYTQLQLDPSNLTTPIDLIATIPFEHADLHAKDILGQVYEPSGARQTAEGSPQGERGGVHQYFIGQFALAEGKKGGQYFTPKSIVGLIVEMLEPYKGRVYDPAMGSGGFFVQSERFIESRAERDRLPEAARRVSAAARINHRRLTPLRLWAREQPHYLAPRRDEHGHPRHRLQFRQGTSQLLH